MYYMRGKHCFQWYCFVEQSVTSNQLCSALVFTHFCFKSVSIIYISSGYSTTIGEFTGDTDFDVAIGMPKGSNLTGKVCFWDHKHS